jgi:DNA-binding transcriptional regulator YdaS (Cro superfamily)
MQEINPIDEPVVRKALLALGISQQLLANWRVRGVPLDRCSPIEIQSGRVVTRQMLRPNDWHIHWPELAAQPEPDLKAAVEAQAA